VLDWVPKVIIGYIVWCCEVDDECMMRNYMGGWFWAWWFVDMCVGSMLGMGVGVCCLSLEQSAWPLSLS